MPENTTMISRGTLTILAIVLLGASMASVAVWYHYRSGRQCLEIWGVEGANLIRHAPRVEALRLAPLEPANDSSASSAEPPASSQTTSTAETLTLGDQEFAVLHRLDISKARGLLHARHALIVDVNFEPDRQPAPLAPDWKFVLCFQEGTRQVLLALDPEHDYVRLYPIDRGQALRAATMRAEVAFIGREFEDAKKK